MNSEKQFNFHKLFVIGAIVLGVGFFLFSLIFTRVIDKPEMKTTKMEIPDQKREAVLKSPGQSTIQEPKLPSAADIEATIVALENLDTTEGLDEWVEGASDEASPSYEEERISNSPEFREINSKIIVLQLELTELQLELTEWGNVERPAKDAYHEYMRNPYSVFGLTKDEGFETELSDEELEFMRREGERLRQEAETEYAEWKTVWDEYMHQQRELRQQLLSMEK